MGNGNYSLAAHEALLRGRVNLPAQNVFKQEKCHPLMNPKGVRLRESRDGTDHPQSLGIVFALDVTGSMGEIPKLMATQQLPSFMKTLMDCQIQDPQLLFMAIGDAVSDNAPLQVGQYELTAELMDQWLTWSYLEGGGGGTGQESDELGLYFLAMHSEMDCMIKRKKRGYLFMTGDEVPYPTLSKHVVEAIIGDNLDEDLTCEEVVAEVQKSLFRFLLFQIMLVQDAVSDDGETCSAITFFALNSPVDVCFVSAGAILLSEGRATNINDLTTLLTNAGLPSSRRKAVIRSLTPYAEVVLNIKPSSSWLSRLF